jgi:hypothetical protein
MTKCRCLLLLLALCVSGCGLTAAQRDATSKFADAATKFGDASSTELVKMKDQTIAMNVALYRVPDLPKKYLAPNTDPIILTYISSCGEKGQPCEYKNLAGDFSGDWYVTFLSGPQAMKAYGTALTGIMNADNKDQIKKSSDALAAALKAIPGSPVANASSDAISAIAQQLTEWFLDDMKAHAIRSVVAATKDAGPVICGTVRDNFFLATGTQTPKDNFAFRFQTTARILAATSETAISLNPRDRLARSDSLNAYLLGEQNLDEAGTTFPQIEKSSSACIAANTALENALQNTTFEIKDIEDFYASAQQATSNIKSLK